MDVIQSEMLSISNKHLSKPVAYINLIMCLTLITG